MKKGKLNLYCDLLYQYNKKVRLTGSREYESVCELVQSSIIPFENLSLKNGYRALDFGTGGGLPGIPLAIIFPNVHFTLIDSISKKIDAVTFFVNELKLTNVTIVHSRIESFFEDDFDYILSRAVAKLNILIELLSGKSKIGGKLFFYKGKNYIDELKDSEQIQDIMGVKLEKIIDYPSDNHLLIFLKFRNSLPDYPRPYKKIIKSPVT
jgi:16S rRNA (guanine527-N7)-methyltransferase